MLKGQDTQGHVTNECGPFVFTVAYCDMSTLFYV